MSELTLWRFALRLWRHPRIEKACLQLQDEHQVPVAVLLTALWLSQTRCRPDPALGRALLADAEQFEKDYLRPLRAVRRRAAEHAEMAAFKEQVLSTELAGERLLLEHLGAQEPSQRETQPVSALSWLRLVVPEADHCQSLQVRLTDLAALSEEPAVYE